MAHPEPHCPEAYGEESVIAYLCDDDSAETQRFAEHLQTGCEACAHKLRSLQSIQEALSTWTPRSKRTWTPRVQRTYRPFLTQNESTSTWWWAGTSPVVAAVLILIGVSGGSMWRWFHEASNPGHLGPNKTVLDLDASSSGVSPSLAAPAADAPQIDAMASAGALGPAAPRAARRATPTLRVAATVGPESGATSIQDEYSRLRQDLRILTEDRADLERQLEDSEAKRKWLESCAVSAGEDNNLELRRDNRELRRGNLELQRDNLELVNSALDRRRLRIEGEFTPGSYEYDQAFRGYMEALRNDYIYPFDNEYLSGIKEYLRGMDSYYNGYDCSASDAMDLQRLG